MTGASGGIGRATYNLLISEGYEVCVIVRNDEHETSFNEGVRNRVRILKADLAIKEQVEEVAQKIQDIAKTTTREIALVTCSGIVNSAPTDCPDWDAFERTFKINALSPFRLSQAIIPIMRETGSGRIIHLSSVEGHMTFPFVSAYSASKHALEAVCSALRLENHQDGIQVTSIVPGFVNTPIWDKAEAIMLEQFAASRHYELMKAIRPKFLELGRSGLDPTRVAKSIVKVLEQKKQPARVVLVQIYLVEWVLMRIIPLRFRDWLIRKFVGLG